MVQVQAAGLVQTRPGLLSAPTNSAGGADLRLGLGYRLHERVVLWGDASLLVLLGQRRLTLALGPVARGQVLLYRGGTWGLLFDGSVGGYTFTRPFPTGGTSLNLTRQLGLAVAVAREGGGDVSVGVRQVHVSNQDALGRRRNPGFDSLAAYVGGAL